MRKCLLFTSNVVRMFCTIFFPTNSPTKGIVFIHFVGKSQTTKRSNYIICDKQSITHILRSNRLKFIHNDRK